MPDPSRVIDYNRYAYGLGNPVKFSDPSGHEPCATGAWGDCVPSPTRGQIDNLAESRFRSGQAWDALNADTQAVLETNGESEGMYNDRGGNAQVQTGWKDPATLVSSLFGVGRLALKAGPAVVSLLTSPSVWNQNPFERGVAIENMLGRSAHLTQNFPVIDRFQGGIATSIKSIDLTAKSYQNINTLTRTVQGHVNKLAQWQGQQTTWGGVRIDPTQVTGRVVELAIPQGAATPAQMRALQQAQQYATQAGVQLNIIPIR